MDFSVVAIAGSVLGVLLAAFLALAIRWVPDAEGASHWALAFVPFAIGSALSGRAEALPALLLVLREPVVLMGYGLLLIGLRQYLKLSQPWTLTGAVIMASLMASAAFVAVVPSVEGRLAARSAGIFILSAAALLSLRHIEDAALREVRYYLQGGFGGIAGISLVRLGVLLLPLPIGEEQVLAFNDLAFTVTWLFLLAVITGLALLLTGRMNAALQSLSLRDPLTGVLNRRGLEEAVRATLSFVRRIGRPVALLACDLDHFKQVNDEHGHPRGDAVLVEFARMLAAQHPRAELVGRLGGEEFAVVLPGVDGGEAMQAAESLRRRLAEHRFEVGGAPLALTVSIGVAAMPGTQANWETLMRLADAALYQAKAEGRDRCMLASASGLEDAVVEPDPSVRLAGLEGAA